MIFFISKPIEFDGIKTRVINFSVDKSRELIPTNRDGGF